MKLYYYFSCVLTPAGGHNIFRISWNATILLLCLHESTNEFCHIQSTRHVFKTHYSAFLVHMFKSSVIFRHEVSRTNIRKHFSSNPCVHEGVWNHQVMEHENDEPVGMGHSQRDLWDQNDREQIRSQPICYKRI
jgi:hypothetical protein